MWPGEVMCLGGLSVWKIQGERVKKYAKLHEKKVHFDGNLEESKDIFNHGKGTKICEFQCTINWVLSTFLGASNTFLFIKIVHIINRVTIS